MRLEGVEIDRLEALVEQLVDIRHDLGKYITFEVRFLGADPQDEELREALKSDLYSTLRRGEHVLSAWDVWEKLRPDVLEGDPDVVAIDEALLMLRGVDLDQQRADLWGAVETTRVVGEAARNLHRRGQNRMIETGLMV